MGAAYLNVFSYAPFKDKGGVQGKPAVLKILLASAYVPVIGTISQLALLVLSVAGDKKNFSRHSLLALRVTLTLVPPLLLAIDVITTIVQASINKKERKKILKEAY